MGQPPSAPPAGAAAASPEARRGARRGGRGRLRSCCFEPPPAARASRAVACGRAATAYALADGPREADDAATGCANVAEPTDAAGGSGRAAAGCAPNGAGVDWTTTERVVPAKIQAASAVSYSARISVVIPSSIGIGASACAGAEGESDVTTTGRVTIGVVVEGDIEDGAEIEVEAKDAEEPAGDAREHRFVAVSGGC